MGDIQFVVLLVLAAAVLVRVADLVHVPSPIVLVLGGLGIALIPNLPRVDLPPDVVFLVFLPPLVHASGWNASAQELRAVIRPLAVLSIGLVFATAGVVAVVAHALVPGMGWAAAAVLGAALAPTDAVAATATFRRVGGPERLRLLVTGESMINDATGLVIYRIAVGAAAGGAFSAGTAVLQFVGNSVGGIVVGFAVGSLVRTITRRQSDTPLVALFTVLGAYGSYVAASELHASGILAAVVTGMYTGWNAPRDYDADTRLNTVAFWQVMVFGLEITLFVLLGLQLPEIVRSLDASSSSVGSLIGPAAAVVGAAVAVRLVWVLLMGEDGGESLRERFVLGWSGMRGAVSLAAALAVPLEVKARPQIVFLAFAMILFTLVVQGLTLPLIVRALGVEEPRRWSEEEAVARMEAAQAALDRLDELEEEGAREQQLERLRDLYRRRFRICQAILAGAADEPGAAERQERIESYGDLRRDLLGVERETLLGLRGEGRLRQATLRQIQRDLDLEEARLRV